MNSRKKILLSVLLSLLLSLVAAGVWVAGNMLPVATGFAAKCMCSCVFVAGRSPASVENLELDRAIVKWVSVKVDTASQKTVASLLGVARQTAIFRQGLGCTLVEGISEDSLRRQLFANPREKMPRTDTLYWPTGDRDTLPFPANVNLPKLEAAVNQAFEENHPAGKKNTQAVVVVYKGKIVGEKYAEGMDQHTPQMGWSMTKSVTNAMLGTLAQESRVSVIQPVYSPEWGMGDTRANLKLDHLLRMSSGLKFNEMYGSSTDVTRMLFMTGNTGAYAASMPQVYPADSVWSYSSGTTNIISRYIRFLYQDYNSYLRLPYESLFARIGMSSAVMEVDASGTYVGSSFCYATARDWARFGLLYLNSGTWEGETIIPEGWVEYSYRRTPSDPYGRYAAHFWTNATRAVPDDVGYHYWPDLPEDLYYASGFDGQYVVIIPSREVVIVRLGTTVNRDAFNIGDLASGVLGAIQSEY
ncbi:MAG: serine hydrolase [Bacteroidia bacterium]